MPQQIQQTRQFNTKLSWYSDSRVHYPHCKDNCYFNLTKQHNDHLTLAQRTKNWTWRCEQMNRATMLRSRHSKECVWLT